MFPVTFFSCGNRGAHGFQTSQSGRWSTHGIKSMLLSWPLYCATLFSPLSTTALPPRYRIMQPFIWSPKGDVCDLNNYRLIILISVVSKALRFRYLCPLCPILEREGLLSDCHRGFCSRHYGRSTSRPSPDRLYWTTMKKLIWFHCSPLRFSIESDKKVSCRSCLSSASIGPRYRGCYISSASGPFPPESVGLS